MVLLYPFPQLSYPLSSTYYQQNPPIRVIGSPSQKLPHCVGMAVRYKCENTKTSEPIHWFPVYSTHVNYGTTRTTALNLLFYQAESFFRSTRQSDASVIATQSHSENVKYRLLASALYAAFPLQGAVRFGSPQSGREGAV